MEFIFLVNREISGNDESGIIFIASTIEKVQEFISNHKDITGYNEWSRWYWKVKKMLINYDSENTTQEEDNKVKHGAVGYIDRDGNIFKKNPYMWKEGEQLYRDK